MAQPKLGDVVRSKEKHGILAPPKGREDEPWVIIKKLPGANGSIWYFLQPIGGERSIWIAGEDWFEVDEFLTAVRHVRYK